MDRRGEGRGRGEGGREIRERQQSVNKWLKRRLGEGEVHLVYQESPSHLPGYKRLGKAVPPASRQLNKKKMNMGSIHLQWGPEFNRRVSLYNIKL